ncbi:hypothetical protein ACOTVD_11280, partial [Campylobacter jejuni]
MLVSKTTLSYLSDNNLKEHINYAIENKNILAIINREFNEDENGNRVDDITPQEIQAATQAVKEYCLANNNMNLYFKYLLAISQEDEKLNVLKEKKKHEIQTKRDEALE